MHDDLSPVESLKAAVRSNDAGAVAAVLQRFPELAREIDRPLPDFDFDATALLGAVYRGNREMVDVLLRAGADINARSGWWAGSFGVLDHDGDLTDFLIERGATIDVYAAARLGMTRTLETLLDADPALVHARGGDGRTPLHVARTVEVARVLLDRGAEIDALDVDHESTPAQYLIGDHQDVVRELVSRGARTDILMGAALGDAALVERHLAADAAAIRTHVSDECFPKRDPRSGGTIYTWTLGAGRTPHLVACDFGHQDVFGLLMRHTPDELALVVACEVGDEAAVETLLARRPRLANALTAADARRIADAARDDNVAAVRLMLDAGWPVDARGQHGATALHWAAWNGNVVAVRLLVGCGAPLEVTDTEHTATPLSWAIHASVHGWRRRTGDYGGTVQALLEAGAHPPSAIDDTVASDAVRETLRRWRGGRRRA